MKGLFQFIAFILIVAMACMAKGQAAISPDTKEIAAHLIGEAPVIRMDFRRFRDLEFVGLITVELLVDEQGNVTSAKIEGDDTPNDEGLTRSQREMAKALVTEAGKTAMKLHFQPFERGGHPAPAEFEIELPVRALDARPPKHVPFPAIHDWNLVKIVLSRTGCFGTCPSYSVEVHGDGTVLYNGTAFVAVTGSHHGSVSSEAVFEIVEAFRAADFFSLKGAYMWGATDLPMYKTSISLGGRKKEVIDYAGEEVGMPESVSQLEQTIDRLSGVERWTKGNGETVPALIAEKFDFKSPEASGILANVAQMGNADAVRDLLAAGAIPSAQLPHTRFRSGTALEEAAGRGDAEMLRVLLMATTNEQPAKSAALKRAVFAGKIDAMRILISYGADPTAPDVLIGAAHSGIPAVVQEILKYRPDINARGANGATALIACLQGQYGVKADVNVKEVVRILIDGGADPNLADFEGKTPLIVNSWDIEAAQVLIDHGANANARSQDGLTPLLNAGTAELTRLLLEHGADPFAKTERGETALDRAQQANRKDQAALLEAAVTGKKQ